MYVTVSVLQGNKRILSMLLFLFFFLYFHPFFHTNDSLFFPSLKKKINAKMFNTICIVFLGGVFGEIV